MIYANDEIFNIGYNSKLDRLEIKNKKTTSKNKIIRILIVLFGVFSIMNCMLIYTFMELLKNL